MKNIIKLTGIIAFVALIGFVAAGCDLFPDPRTPLTTPNIWIDHANHTEFKLKWDAVPNAVSYTVNIDGQLFYFDSSRTEYDLKNLTLDPKVYTIRVQAVPELIQSTHANSAWSEIIDCEPAEYIFQFDSDSPSSNMRSVVGGNVISGLTTYGRTLERIVIPPTIGSIVITAIGNEAFKNNDVMRSVSLPETITAIGNSAFSGTDISSIIIPETVRNIGDGAFSNCNVLTVIVFASAEPPDLGEGVFAGSNAIEAIVVPDNSADTYTEMLEDKAPEIAEQLVEEKDTKILIGIEVVNLPKTVYNSGDTFSSTGMIIRARYSDNTTNQIQGYKILLRSNTGGTSGSSGDFIESNRALNVNDTVVRISYEEDGVTMTTDISITVNPPPQATFIVTFNAEQGGWAGINGNTRSITVPAGQTIDKSQIPDPVRQGYTFDGWFTSLSTEIPFDFDLLIITNFNLTAKWTLIEEDDPIPTDPMNGIWKKSDVVNFGYELTLTISGNEFEFFVGSMKYAKGTITPNNGSYIFTATHAGDEDDNYAEWHKLDTPEQIWECRMTVNGNSLIISGIEIDGMIDLNGTWTRGSQQPPQTIYNVTFNANGGIFPVSSHPDGGSNTITLQIEAGRFVTQIPTPIRQGYNFSGWFTIVKATTGETTSETEIPFTSNTPIYSHMEVFAKWTSSGDQPPQQITYIVIFNAGEGGWSGSTNTRSITVPAGQPISQSQVPNPTRQGYNFNGWFTIQKATTGGTTGETTTEGEIPFYFNTPINSNMEVFAKWTSSGDQPDPPIQTTYIVTFDAGQGGWAGFNGNIRTIQVEAGRSIESSQVPNPTRQGYNFNGWVTIQKATTGGTTGETTTEGEIPFYFNNPINSNMEVFAKWTPTGQQPPQQTTYTVTFNAGQGGWAGFNGNIRTVQVQAGQMVRSSDIPPPALQNHTFSGWFIHEKATTGGTTGGTTTESEIPFNFNTSIYSDMEVFAKWTPTGDQPDPPIQTTYTVTFNAEQGGWAGFNGNIRTVQVQAGQMVRSSDIPPPALQNHTFSGWVTIEKATTGGTTGGTTTESEIPFNFNAPINSHMEVFAKWTPTGQQPQQQVELPSSYLGNWDLEYDDEEEGKKITTMIITQSGLSVLLDDGELYPYFDFLEVIRLDNAKYDLVVSALGGEACEYCPNCECSDFLFYTKIRIIQPNQNALQLLIYESETTFREAEEEGALAFVRAINLDRETVMEQWNLTR